MLQVVCNRCRAVVASGTLKGSAWVAIDDFTTDDKRRREAHLCGECLADFLDWLSGPIAGDGASLDPVGPIRPADAAAVGSPS